MPSPGSPASCGPPPSTSGPSSACPGDTSKSCDPSKSIKTFKSRNPNAKLGPIPLPKAYLPILLKLKLVAETVLCKTHQNVILILILRGEMQNKLKEEKRDMAEERRGSEYFVTSL